MHNLLDRPRDRPKRTAAGAAMLALLFTLFAASSTDVLANFFHVSLNEVLWFFRIASCRGARSSSGFITWRICLEMQGVARHRPAQAGPGRVAHGLGRVPGRARRTPAPATAPTSSRPNRSRPGSTSSRRPWWPPAGCVGSTAERDGPVVGQFDLGHG